MGTVVQLHIPPKTETFTHKRVPITLSYIPSTREWSYSFSYTQTLTFSGVCASLAEAKARATALVNELNPSAMKDVASR